jgi:hypothetical protein
MPQHERWHKNPGAAPPDRNDPLLIPDLDKAHLVPFMTTDLERELAIELGIPMYAADPRFYAFGTKSGCRRVFIEENIPHPFGMENLHDAGDLIQAIEAMRHERPEIQKAIVKLNEGVSGLGNAQLDLSGLPEPGSPAEKSALETRLKSMQFVLPELTYESYMQELRKKGGIVEELIQGEEIHSPSVQLRISPLGKVELLSTRPDVEVPAGSTWGARFPANPEYGRLILQEAAKIGKRFACEGVIGRCHRFHRGASTRIGSRTQSRSTCAKASTHPYLTPQYLTGGCLIPNRPSSRLETGRRNTTSPVIMSGHRRTGFSR